MLDWWQQHRVDYTKGHFLSFLYNERHFSHLTHFLMEPKYFFDKFALSEKEEMFVDMDRYMNVCGYRYINVRRHNKLWTNDFNVHISYA